LVLDPNNIEALVGTALVDTNSILLIDNRAARIAAAEAVLTKALSMAPQHALAHMLLGVVQMFTNRADQGIAECQQALALDRNLASAHGFIGAAQYLLGRAAETE
jgi:Flp pilus assembly protein TadD